MATASSVHLIPVSQSLSWFSHWSLTWMFLCSPRYCSDNSATALLLRRRQGSSSSCARIVSSKSTFPPCPVFVVVILIPRRNVNTCHWGWRIPRPLPGKQRYTAAPNPFLLFQILFLTNTTSKADMPLLKPFYSFKSLFDKHNKSQHPFIFTKLLWSIFFVEAIRCLKVVCFLAEIQLPTTASVFFYFSLS